MNDNYLGLGVSPDGLVFDPFAEPPFGLLEIKCLGEVQTDLISNAEYSSKVSVLQQISRSRTIFERKPQILFTSATDNGYFRTTVV